MSRPPRNATPPRKVNPEREVPDPGHDPLAYLEEGAIVPPKKPLELRRTSSRRGFVAAGIAAIGATAWFGVPLNTEGRFYPGAMVHDLSIAELNRPQALAALKARFSEFENTAIDYEFEGQRWNASLGQIGFTIDYDTTLTNAWSHGREESQIKQFTNVLFSPNEQSYPVIFKQNEEQLRSYLDDLGQQIVGASHDAMLYLDGDIVRVQPNKDGRALDIEAAVEATRTAVKAAERQVVPLSAQPVVSQITAAMLEPKRALAQTMIGGPVRINSGDSNWTISQSTLRAALVLPERGVLADPGFDENVLAQSLAEMETAVKVTPKDAVLGWNDGLTVVTPDIKGRDLDVAATVQSVVVAAKTTDSRQIDVTFNVILAEVNADELDKLGITHQLASGDSNFAGSSWERAENVRISADHLTHTLVKPGATYGFNEAIGPITLENGFVEGKIIRGSWIVSDIGGGACQASTTVFRAALKAGLPIDHTPHQFRLAMYEHDGWSPGLDAAIYQPNPGSGDWETNLLFTNNTDNWLLVEFVIEDTMAYCNIYGTPQGYDVSIEVPFISEPKKPEGPVETEDPKLAKGEREQVGWATDGYDVMAIRTIKKDGEVVQAEGLINPWEFWSKFQPQRDEFLIGPGTKREFGTEDSTPDSGG